jgi:hypothetical protein
MMRHGLAFLGLLLMSAVALRAEDITLDDGTVYKGATILHHDAATATILYDDGGAAVPIAKLPAAIQKRLNYDPAAAQRLLVDDATADAQAQALAQRTRVLDNAALKVWGTIVRVESDGVLAKIETVDKCAPPATVTQTTAVNTLPPGLGGTDVVRTTVIGYRRAKIELGKVFIETATTGLVDKAHWRGIVWPVGTYSYVGTTGKHHTIPAYTVSPDRAYQALAQAAPAP